MDSTTPTLETFQRLDFEIQLSALQVRTLCWGRWETIDHAPTAAKARSNVAKRLRQDLGLSKLRSTERRYRVVRIESTCTVLT